MSPARSRATTKRKTTKRKTAKRKTEQSHRYSPHPSLEYARGVIARMKEKTGHSLEEWTALARKGPKDGDARARFLAERHGLGTNYAAYIADLTLGKNEELTDDAAYLALAVEHVEEQYSGPRAALRPIFERVLDLALALGDDVKVCPCKTIVPIFREHVIAQLKASTRTRVDLGLALAKHRGRLPKALIDTGGAAKKDRITHRLELHSLDDVGPEVERWLRAAYELDG